MHQLSGLRDRLPELRNLFGSERSLLLPMTVLALGIHAALLALPIPSNEALKTPDDQKNPIKVTQIPTEKPPEVASSTGVTIPPLSTPSVTKSVVSSPSLSDSASSTSDASESSDSSDSSSLSSSDTAAVTPSKPVAVSPAKKATKSTVTKASAKPSSGNASSGSATEESSSSSAGETTESAEPSADGAVTAIASPTVPRSQVSAAAFANFPQFKSSTGDCFGLGLGDNCRVVENGAIAEVTNYFRKELPAKQFKAELVTDEPTRKVFKVSKDNKTLFLNILQSKQNVVYLLSSVVYKQSPDEITEKGQ